VLLGSLLVYLAEVLSRLSLPLRMGRDRGREMELERTGGGLFLGFRARISSGGYFSCLERAGRPVSAARCLASFAVGCVAWTGCRWPAAIGFAWLAVDRTRISRCFLLVSSPFLSLAQLGCGHLHGASY